MSSERTELFAKYDKPSPRYTSYPAIPFWENNVENLGWKSQIEDALSMNENIDLYIHLPYCEQLCYYCGCNRVVTKDHTIEKEYILTLIKEWETYTKEFPDIKIKNIHLGGGTPTFMSPSNLSLLLNSLKPYYNKDGIVAAVEMDPRITTIDHIILFKEFGFKRASLGIQDFDDKVQKAINRIQSVELINKLLIDLRHHGFSSVNFDLIYGLPLQDEQSFQNTIDEVIKLSPDTISLFGYAHLPDKIKNQKALNKYSILSGKEKYNLFELSKIKLVKNDYQFIGLDHFSKKSDELYKSLSDGTLSRTFMGYVKNASKINLGIGVSAISTSGFGFIQNQKDIPKYIEEVNKGHLPIQNGHQQNLEDKKIEHVIQDIMCLGYADISEFILFSGKERAQQVLSELALMIDDQLITLNNGILTVQQSGTPFLRNICMVFDYRLSKT